MGVAGGRGRRILAGGTLATMVCASAALAGLIPVPIEYETDSRPIAVAIGRVDSDPTKDLAVAHRDGRSVAVLPGDGGGGFADAELHDTAGLQATGVQIAKVNGDSRPDLVVAGNGSDPGTDRLLVLRGKASGFRAPQEYPLPTASAFDVAVGDLNRDGDLDAVVGDSNGSSVTVKYGRAGGEFGRSRTYAFPRPGDPEQPSEPQHLGIGDFDRNGFKDVAVSVGRNGAVGVLYTKTKRRNGELRARTGRFRKTAYEVDGLPYGLAAGDLNLDGRLDLVAPNDYNAGNETVSILYGKGRGTTAGFRAHRDIDTGHVPYGGIEIGRFDEDSRPDIAVSYTNGLAYLYGDTGEPDGFSEPFDFGLVDGAIGLRAARLSDDTEDDLAVAQWNGGSVAVVLEED